MDGLMDGCDLDLYHVEKWAIEKERELWLLQEGRNLWCAVRRCENYKSREAATVGINYNLVS